MVMKIWNTDAELDLNTLADNYGIENDVIVAATLTPIIGKSLYTYEGDDVVYTTRLHQDSVVFINTSSGDDRFYGGAAQEYVTDGSGNDYAYGGAGDDYVHAGTGDDYYHGGTGIDTLSFYYGEDGVDPEGVTADLAIGTRQDFGTFDLDVIRAFENLRGTNDSDVLSGNALANELIGEAGNDVLSGRNGNDMLVAGNGADRLIGGQGQDTFALGEGAAARDTVVYQAYTDSAATISSADIINTFDFGGTATDDKIDLSALDASLLTAGDQSFVFRSTGAITTSSAGEVRLLVSGGNTFIYVDNDADTAAEMIIRVNGVTTLTAADFIL